MKPTTDELRCWDREIVWHAFTQMAEYEPLIFESAHGCTLVDIEGREYLDGVSSLWCNVHGHRHPTIDSAIRRQLDSVAHVTLLGASNRPAIELAKRLTELAPEPLNHVFFSDDGATAVEAAIKMAFQYWRQRSDPKPAKIKYAAFDNAYHGDTLGANSVGGVARFHAMFQPLLFDVIRLPAPDCYRTSAVPPGSSPLEHYLRVVEETFLRHSEEIAAVVIEPLVQMAAGILMHPAGFFRGLCEAARRRDILVIADEVAVGFGRTGAMFACENEAASPDILCLAKGLTGGYLPMSATLTTDEIWNAFLGGREEQKTFFHGHTYGGNALGAAAALASLDVFDREQTLANLPPKIERLESRLATIAKLPRVGDVRQKGLIAGVELVQDRASKKPFPWEEKRGIRVCEHALQNGVWLRPLGDVVVIMPPLSVTLEEIDRICSAVEQGIVAATDDGSVST